MTDQAKAARRAYKRKWAKAHPDRVKQYQIRYWEKRARQEAEGRTTGERTQEDEPGNPPDDDPVLWWPIE